MMEAAQPRDREALARECVAYLRPLLNFVRRRLRFSEAQGDLRPGEQQAEGILNMRL